MTQIKILKGAFKVGQVTLASRGRIISLPRSRSLIVTSCAPGLFSRERNLREYGILSLLITKSSSNLEHRDLDLSAIWEPEPQAVGNTVRY